MTRNLSHETNTSSENGNSRSTDPQTNRCVQMFKYLRVYFFTVYQRIYGAILLVNLIGLVAMHLNAYKLDHFATAASANILLAIFVRQDVFVKALFGTAWHIPWSAPLRCRLIVTRIYMYGGAHSGAAVMATAWFFAYTVYHTILSSRANDLFVPSLVLAWILIILLTLICFFSYPELRSNYHNSFEFTHRFLGWTSILIFWAQLIVQAYYATQTDNRTNRKVGLTLIQTPAFFLLALTTFFIALPWLNLRRWTFTRHFQSGHALCLHTPNPVHRFSVLAIATHPLGKYHPFATFPSTDKERPGTCLVISAAGDWTKGQIQQAFYEKVRRSTASSDIESNSKVPLRFWIKGWPKPGVLSLTYIYSRVVIVTTGSGIGPTLSSLTYKPKDQKVRLVWSVRSPMETYGGEICNTVKKLVPDAIIIDTEREGRPELLEVAKKVLEDFEAEAVFVLSNETVTKEVVHGLEMQGLRAFGPIWDS